MHLRKNGFYLGEKLKIQHENHTSVDFFFACVCACDQYNGCTHLLKCVRFIYESV